MRAGKAGLPLTVAAGIPGERRQGLSEAAQAPKKAAFFEKNLPLTRGAMRNAYPDAKGSLALCGRWMDASFRTTVFWGLRRETAPRCRSRGAIPAWMLG